MPKEILDLTYGITNEVSHEDLCKVVDLILDKLHLTAVRYTNENTGPGGEILLEGEDE